MKKESFSDKLIKRFYGISGPLDEYKRREADKIGNLDFIILSFLLLVGNAFAFLLASKYPEVVAFGYPVFLTLVILALFAFLILKSQSSHLISIDLDQLSPKEEKQLRHVGVKAGLHFGIGMYFFTAVMDFFLHDLPFLTSLAHGKTILTGIIDGLLFGLFTTIFVKLKTNRKDET